MESVISDKICAANESENLPTITSAILFQLTTKHSISIQANSRSQRSDFNGIFDAVRILSSRIRDMATENKPDCVQFYTTEFEASANKLQSLGAFVPVHGSPSQEWLRKHIQSALLFLDAEWETTPRGEYRGININVIALGKSIQTTANALVSITDLKVLNYKLRAILHSIRSIVSVQIMEYMYFSD